MARAGPTGALATCRAGRAGSERRERGRPGSHIPSVSPVDPQCLAPECVTLWTRLHLLQSRRGEGQAGPRSGLRLLPASALGPGPGHNSCCRSRMFTRRSEHLQSHHSSAFTLKPPSEASWWPWSLEALEGGPHTRRLAAAWPIPGATPCQSAASVKDTGHQGSCGPSPPTSHHWLLSSAPTWWNASGRATQAPSGLSFPLSVLGSLV